MSAISETLARELNQRLEYVDSDNGDIHCVYRT